VGAGTQRGGMYLRDTAGTWYPPCLHGHVTALRDLYAREGEQRDGARGERGGALRKRTVEGLDVLHGPSRFALRAPAPPIGAVSLTAVFVSFEGADGSGKSTQAELLRAALEAEGRDVLLTREPGGTELGEAVRALVLNGPVMGAWAEATLFAASRAEHVEEVIRPALDRGADVVCDRYVDSSLAYQGLARGLGVDAVLQLNLAVTGGLLPDVTFLLLLDPGVATGRHVDPDRLEREGTELQSKVDAAYRELAERFPERIVTIDATGEPEAIAREVRERLRDRS
jgi:dTMP kinase